MQASSMRGYSRVETAESGGEVSGERQGELLPAGQVLPTGFTHQEEFITPDEEAALIEQVAALPLQESVYRQWTARRRTVSFGGHHDFTHQQLHPAAPIPQFLLPLRAQLAGWAGIDAMDFSHASVAEYRRGTQLGWHRDAPDFEVIAGVSLQGMARMRFRPYPAITGWARAAFAIDLRPRSACIIRDTARWRWQHAISPTRELRYAITFRTLRRL
jgi:alkylated DNA repair dioxygenase AlkB